MKTPVVHVADLHKSFGKQPVLQGVNWSIEPGAIVGLLGRNGAGKSTLLECLLSLREADAGASVLMGEPVTALSDTARANIGYVPQKSELFEWMTPVQMLDYFKTLYPRWNAQKVAALLARWGFDAHACGKPISCRAEKSSVCPSSARWLTNRDCWCSTSRWPASTLWAGATSCRNW